MPNPIRLAPAMPQPMLLDCAGDSLHATYVTIPGSNHIQTNEGVAVWNQPLKLYNGNGFDIQFEGGNVLHVWRGGVQTDGTWSV